MGARASQLALARRALGAIVHRRLHAALGSWAAYVEAEGAALERLRAATLEVAQLLLSGYSARLFGRWRQWRLGRRCGCWRAASCGSGWRSGAAAASS